jgi:hypothetical protein
MQTAAASYPPVSPSKPKSATPASTGPESPAVTDAAVERRKRLRAAQDRSNARARERRAARRAERRIGPQWGPFPTPARPPGSASPPFPGRDHHPPKLTAAECRKVRVRKVSPPYQLGPVHPRKIACECGKTVSASRFIAHRKADLRRLLPKTRSRLTQRSKEWRTEHPRTVEDDRPPQCGGLPDEVLRILGY